MSSQGPTGRIISAPTEESMSAQGPPSTSTSAPEQLLILQVLQDQ